MTDARGPQPTIDCAFEWSVREHAHAQHAIAITKLKTEGLMLLFAVALTLLLIGNGVAIWFATRGLPGAMNAVLPATLFIAVTFWVLLWGRGWVDAWRQQRTDSSLQYPIHHIFSDNGMRVRGRSGEIALRWKAMKQVAETREFLLFYFSDWAAYYLPTRVVPAEQLAALRTLIRAQAGGAARLRG